MYRVNRYKLISDLHRKLTRLSTTCCQSPVEIENQKFLNKLPAKISVTRKDLNQANNEFSAVLRLLSRSFGVPSRDLMKSINQFVLWSEKNDNKSWNENDKNAKNNNNDNKHPSYKSDGKYDPPDDEKDPEKEKMLAVMGKTFFTIFMIFTLLGLLVPSKNRPENSTRYVSWNEFVHHMLAVGEVRELVVHPDLGKISHSTLDSSPNHVIIFNF
jgi:hypothetical protein